MIDVIITTYNRVELLKRTMTSFFATTDMELVDKIIISNDGSTDETQEYLESLKDQFPKIQILPAPDLRMGIIPRFNMAFEKTTRGVICEFQDDVEFAAGWLEKLLAHVNKPYISFVTGFHAPDHYVYNDRGDHLIKHSSRFTQLMARREIWEKHFPMTPKHPFPTPTMRDGRQIGSNIDMALFDMRKNNPRGKVKFLVVPGLIRHTAERYNSTWRNDISDVPDRRTKYFGGIMPNEAKKYWKDRYNSQKDIAVGFAGKARGIQERIMKEKKDFIMARIDNKLRVIDYGCGVGKFSKCFDPNLYLGLDITEEFIALAKENNPKYNYEVLDGPVLESSLLKVKFDMFFTANVLQHNCDYTVAELFKNLANSQPGGFIFCLYENTHSKLNTTHMCFRTVHDYLGFIGEHFEIKEEQSFSHVVHGEEQTLIKVKV